MQLKTSDQTENFAIIPAVQGKQHHGVGQFPTRHALEHNSGSSNFKTWFFIKITMDVLQVSHSYKVHSVFFPKLAAFVLFISCSVRICHYTQNSLLLYCDDMKDSSIDLPYESLFSSVQFIYLFLIIQ